MVECLQDLTILTDRLSKINEALARKTQARNEYDRTIQETEAAYMKVLGERFLLDNPECRGVLIVYDRSWRARRHYCMCSSARPCS